MIAAASGWLSRRPLRLPVASHLGRDMDQQPFLLMRGQTAWAGP